MTTILVKAAKGRLVRHPATRRPLPGIDDAGAEPVAIDDADPFWYRRLADGDLIAAPPAKAARATTAASE